MNKDEEMERVGTEIDSWLDGIDESDEMSGKSKTEVQDFDTIVDGFCQIAIIGLNQEPQQWNNQLLSEVMFSNFSLFLEEKDKNEKLYSCIPEALINLFRYLNSEEIINNGKTLINWVNKNEKKLVSLYNPKFDEFYQKLTKAMQDNNVDTENKNGVNNFTKKFLREHPEMGVKLYSDKK